MNMDDFRLKAYKQTLSLKNQTQNDGAKILSKDKNKIEKSKQEVQPANVFVPFDFKKNGLLKIAKDKNKIDEDEIDKTVASPKSNFMNFTKITKPIKNNLENQEKKSDIKTSEQTESVYRRVAKFLLIIGVDEAAKILSHLPEEQTEKIVRHLASVQNIAKDESEKILQEFEGMLETARTDGGVLRAKEILQKTYGAEKAQKVLENAVPFPDGKPFEYLASADAEKILALVADESDAVRALVLAHLEPKKSAAVINAMNAQDKANIVMRLAKMQSVLPEVVRSVDRTMREKALALSVEKASDIDGKTALAEILRKMPEAVETEILSSLSETDAELTEDLRARLFTQEDVENADDKFIQEKLRAMSDAEIAFLIAAKSDAFRKKIFRNISTGRGDMILEQEQIMRPMKRSDVEKATAKFLGELRRAYENGALRIAGRDDDEYVY